MTYNITLQQRKTRAQFTASNDVIPASTLCIETDTGTYTVGDGSARYMVLRGNQQLTSDERRSADDVWAMLGAQTSGSGAVYLDGVAQGGIYAFSETTDAGGLTTLDIGALVPGATSATIIGVSTQDGLAFVYGVEINALVFTVGVGDINGLPTEGPIVATFMVNT